MVKQKSFNNAATSYFFFSGISTFLAFFLPLHLWTIINNHLIGKPFPILTNLAVWDLFLIMGLHHGRYRLKTMINDLGIEKKAKTYKKIIDRTYYFGLLILFLLHIFFVWLLFQLGESLNGM